MDKRTGALITRSFVVTFDLLITYLLDDPGKVLLGRWLGHDDAARPV